MIAGNVLGGRFADRAPTRAVLATLTALTLVLAAMTLAIHSQVLVVAFTGILGIAAFATVSPLQLRVLRHAQGAGQNLASSFNIAALTWATAWARGWAGWWWSTGRG